MKIERKEWFSKKLRDFLWSRWFNGIHWMHHWVYNMFWVLRKICKTFLTYVAVKDDSICSEHLWLWNSSTVKDQKFYLLNEGAQLVPFLISLSRLGSIFSSNSACEKLHSKEFLCNLKGIVDALQRNELYLEYQHSWLKTEYHWKLPLALTTASECPLQWHRCKEEELFVTDTWYFWLYLKID